MAPTRTKKRTSNASPAPESPLAKPAAQLVPTKSSATPTRSPIKKRRGITIEQKKAIIENLQLEVTDRARRLRAQYHARAQSLRSRVEMRVARIPRALLKLTMEELLAKSTDQQKRLAAAARPPPVPAKDYPPRHSPVKAAAHASRASPRPRKRNSDEIGGVDKENQVGDIDNPKKKHRGHGPASIVPDTAQILSPTSTNARYVPRDRAPHSPAKSSIARPASPMKAPPSAVRVGMSGSTRPAPTRKTTTSSTASSAVGTTANIRTRRAAAPSKPPVPRPATRTARRISDSSDGSTSTVVKKTVTKDTSAPAAKRTVMGTIRKGVTGGTTRKAAAAPKPTTATASTAGSTRVLRKRG
ncbi:Borealin N terminal-domain-containing protein [Plectosphaerella cucumerina]|uniref:Borealin N terminal-domain-containing protein n=1 Tax=Plectosphaerella cucumerina TaxID=40658 RepID=A0A8K0TT50_9PEZI|nr:Borealin N terminal-domain-containing protein [Plectosphaerella cucumerina]